MARLLDAYPAAIWQRARKLVGGVVGEHVTQRSAHYQRRAFDPGKVSDQPRAILAERAHGVIGAAPLIMLESPLAGRSFAQVVVKAAAQHRGIANRIEFYRALEEYTRRIQLGGR